MYSCERVEFKCTRTIHTRTTVTYFVGEHYYNGQFQFINQCYHRIPKTIMFFV